MATSKANVTLVSVTTVDKNCIGNMLNVTKIKSAGKLQAWNFQIPPSPPTPIQDCFKNQVCALIEEEGLVILRACVALVYDFVSLDPFVHQK